MRIVKPPALRKGDVIGIAAPASPSSSEEKLARGIRYLETIGYRVTLGKYARTKHGYLAGSDIQRATDINDFFSDRNVKAIFSVRGGYGTQRILPLLDYSVIRRNPKILVGYSDVTALHMALFCRAGLVTFSGPMVAVEMAEGLSGASEERFWQSLTTPYVPPPLRHDRDRRRIRGKKNISVGRIVGGNLSLVAALVGTSYLPRREDLIWLIEEIGEQPYRIDRLLQQLKLGGLIPRSKGVVLGRFIDCEPEKGKPSLHLEDIFKETFKGYRYPVCTGAHFGHIKDSLTVPLGVRVEIQGLTGTTHLLEAGVA